MACRPRRDHHRFMHHRLFPLIFNKNWTLLTEHHSPREVCLLLNFTEAMWLTKHLFYDDISNDSNQQFALKLALEIKDHFKNDWDKDWKNDVFLGDLCSLLWLYDQQYFYYKKAYDRLKDPPVALLLLLANCYNAPNPPPISKEEAESYLKKSIEKKITFESALMMRTFYENKGEEERVKYWDRMYKKLKDENIHADFIVPDVLKKNH